MLEHEYNTKAAKVKSHSAEVSPELKPILDRMDRLEKKFSKLLDSKDSPKSAKNEQQLFCRYCKRTNHNIEDCKILARKKSAKGSENSDQSAPGTTE